MQINSDALRIKGIGATAVGDILLGQASDGGYTAHAKFMKYLYQRWVLLFFTVCSSDLLSYFNITSWTKFHGG